MRKIVLDTNCLLMSLPKPSPYRCVWDAFLKIIVFDIQAFASQISGKGN